MHLIFVLYFALAIFFGGSIALFTSSFSQSSPRFLQRISALFLGAVFCFLTACPTPISPEKTSAKLLEFNSVKRTGQNQDGQNRAGDWLEDTQGWVPDVVGIASFTSLETFFSALNSILTALDGKDRLLLGLAQKWKDDFGIDVTRPALLSLAGIDLQKSAYVLWRKANDKAPLEHLFSLPVKSTSRVLGILTQVLAESQHLRHVDALGVVHFTSSRSTRILISVPTTNRLLIWLAPNDVQAAAALMGKALQTPFQQPFLESFFKDKSISRAERINGNFAVQQVAYFSFAQNAMDVLPWTSPLSLGSSTRVLGQWTLEGNAQHLQVDHFFSAQNNLWRDRFASQKLPLSHCALEKEALLTVRLPAEISAQWLPENEFSPTQDRLSGMLSLYLYGRKELHPKAHLLDISRFILAGKPKDENAVQQLKLSVGKDVQKLQYKEFESLKVLQTQPLRALEMLADKRVFAMAFGQEHLLETAFAAGDVACHERNPGLILRGTAARKQRWHVYDSSLARLLGQGVNGIDHAELKTFVKKQSLQLQATVLFVP